MSLYSGIFIYVTVNAAACKNASWLGDEVLSQCHPDRIPVQGLCQRGFASMASKG